MAELDQATVKLTPAERESHGVVTAILGAPSGWINIVTIR